MKNDYTVNGDVKKWNVLSSKYTNAKIILCYGKLEEQATYNNIHFPKSYVAAAFTNPNVKWAQLVVDGVNTGDRIYNTNFNPNYLDNTSSQIDDDLPF